MPDQRHQYVVSVMSRDKVGIVHLVSGTIRRLEGDIEDLRQSVLRGYFTMILLATFPDHVSEEKIRRTLEAIEVEGIPPLQVSLRFAPDATVESNSGSYTDAYVLTAQGKDRIGFVADVSGFCAQRGLNILDLSTTVSGDEYVMMLLVDLSRCQDVGALHSQLLAFGQQADLNVVLQHYDIFRAVQEVSLL